jgi:putative inorganic carbon (HCO3(-)) transporter
VRDLLLLAIIAPGCLMALRYPFVGAMLWAWVSLMSPHRLAFGFMYDAPAALAIALCTLIGLLASPEKRSPMIGTPVKWLTVFIAWMCITTLFAIHFQASFMMLQKVLKIDLMILVTIMLVRTRREIMVLAWVMALSLAFYGVKGGIFTILSGGAYRVYGPDGTYIAENNALAVALIITIPLMAFLRTTLTKGWQRHAMTLAILLCGVSVLGSHSRGALLSISAMLALLWWRGKNKLLMGMLIVSLGLVALSLMPEEWWARMHSIETYEEDRSAMGRLGAWKMAVNLALDRIIGGGFAIWRPDLFARYSSGAVLVVSAHSVYFHVIGEHGFIGLLIYLGIWVATYMSAGWLRKHAVENEETVWAANMGAMIQVSLLGFAVGGAFLSLAYFDLPYNLLILVVTTRWWVQSGAWKNEPAKASGLLFFGDRGVMSPQRLPGAAAD